MTQFTKVDNVVNNTTITPIGGVARNYVGVHEDHKQGSLGVGRSLDECTIRMTAFRLVRVARYPTELRLMNRSTN